jgi:hypothetical protein
MCPRTGTVFEWKYRYRIKTGMTLAEVESILGPGKQEKTKPGTMDQKGFSVPVLQGEELYVWEQDGYLWELTGSRIWVGFQDGKVCDKHLYYPKF